MRKLGLLLLLSAVIFSLMSCGKVNYIRSFNYPDHYFTIDNFLAKIHPIGNDQDLKSAKFRIVPGLADPNCVSFESAEYPGYFLRHQNTQLKLHQKVDDPLFKKDATFRKQPGLADPSWVSFESFNYPGLFIRHSAFFLYIGMGQDDLFHKDATFKIVSSLNE